MEEQSPTNQTEFTTGSDAERRNYILTCLAFIAFFYADGHITEGSLTVQFISITLSDLNALSHLANAILLWFFYRYCITHRGKASKGLLEEFNKYSNSFLVRKFFAYQEGVVLAEYPDTEGYESLWFDFHSFFPEIAYQQCSQIGWNHSSKTIIERVGDNTEYLTLKSPLAFLLLLALLIVCIVKEKTFSDYVFPHLLFLIAILFSINAFFR